MQEASIPLGAVVGILDYIEKRRKSKKNLSSQQRSSTSGGYHQNVPHPPIYSPQEPISRSSAPTPAPSAAYLTQQFQHQESPFPVIGSQVQAESATPAPTHYSMASHYPQQSSQMKPPQFEQLPPATPQYPTSPRDQNVQQQQQLQYIQSHQLQHVNTNAPLHQPVPPSSLPHHQLQYQQTSSSSQAQAQPQLPQMSQQQQVQAHEVHPRSPLVSLPQSSGGGHGSGSSMATSPTTAQRRVSLPTAVASQRGESVHIMLYC